MGPPEGKEIFPSTFGRYTLVERLATGGMAEVFRAKILSTHGFEKLLVIKRILPHLAADRTFVSMFIDEGKLTAQLVHPKIVQVTDFGEVAGQYFIALEFVDGFDALALLRTSAQRQVRLPVPICTFVTMEVLDALDYAHNAKDVEGKPMRIVHRDISPSNVFISHRGDVKLGDFGIAHAQERESKTQAGTLKGKYGYMSPEQVVGSSLDGRSDIFAVGIVLAEMLMGRRLFTAPNDLDVLLMVRDGRLDRLDKYCKDLPPELDDILRRSLKKRVSDRYQTAGEFRDALADLMFKMGFRIGPSDLGRMAHDYFDPSPDALVRIKEQAKKWQARQNIAMSGVHSVFNDTGTPVSQPVGVPVSSGANWSVPPGTPSGPSTKPVSGPKATQAPRTVQVGISDVISADEFEPMERRWTMAGGYDGDDGDEQEEQQEQDEEGEEIDMEVSRADRRQREPEPPPRREPEPRRVRPRAVERDRPRERDAERAVVDSNMMKALDQAFSGSSLSIVDLDQYSTGAPGEMQPAAAPAEMVSNSGQEPTNEGDLALLSPMRVFAQLALAGETGMLRFQFGDIVKDVFLVRGQPETLNSNQPADRFGEFLVARGFLRKPDLDRALAEAPRFGGKLGDALVGLGLMKQLDVVRLLSQQVRDRVMELFAWVQGSFGFFRGERNPTAGFPLGLDSFEILGAGVLMLSYEFLQARYLTLQDFRPKAIAQPPISPEAFRLGNTTREVWAALDGQRAIRDWMGLFPSANELLTFLRVLYLLLETDLAELE